MYRPIIVLAALSLGACSYLTSAESTVTSTAVSVGSAISATVAKAGPAIKAANAKVVNAVAPYADTAVNVFFCNKYAQRAFDPSEAKHQPACTAGK